MKVFKLLMALLWLTMISETSLAASPIFADGDLPPHGSPVGLFNSADYLIADRIVIDSPTPTRLKLLTDRPATVSAGGCSTTLTAGSYSAPATTLRPLTQGES